MQALADESAFIAQLRKTAARHLTVTLGVKAASDAEHNGLLFNRSESTANGMATALHLAAARSYASGCDALLRKIRDTEHEDRVLSAQDTFGRTPLENAFQLAEVPVVVLLLARYQERKLGAVLAQVRPCSWDCAHERLARSSARSSLQMKAQFEAKWAEAAQQQTGPSLPGMCVILALAASLWGSGELW